MSNQETASITEESNEFLRLRRCRSAAKANITKKIKELTEWRTNCQSVEEAISKVKEFDNVADHFHIAHAKYHAEINDEYDILDSD